MNNWKEDKSWSDIFLPEIKSILGIYLIGEAPMEEDRDRNTDLIVLKMEAIRIACRIRRKDYLNAYGNEFTIRCGRPSGMETELTKIIAGWGDYFFYGFGCEETKKLLSWTLADLKIFRLCFMRNLYKGERVEEIPNKDNSSKFIAFPWKNFPDNLIIARC